MIDKDYERKRLNPHYEVFDENGNLINTIVADEDFVKANFSSYKLLPSFRNPKKEIAWRNEMLNQTDRLITLTDYPYKEKLTQWRQTLRDWPNTEDFPETRPVSFDNLLKQE